MFHRKTQRGRSESCEEAAGQVETVPSNFFRLRVHHQGSRQPLACCSFLFRSDVVVS